AAAAPGTVFVAPDLARAIAAAPFAPGASDDETSAPPQVALPSALRIDDDAETPDDLLVAISAAATRARAPKSAAPGAAQVASRAPGTPASAPRETLADVVAHSAPSAPDAGLAAQLASSPFAPALRHVLPLASAPTFDVRALLGGGLVASYLAGLIAERAPRGIADELAPVTASRELAWTATYVAPDAAPGATRTEAELDELGAEQLVPRAIRTSLLAVQPSVARAATSRDLVASLALPMLGDPESAPTTAAAAPQQAVASTAPGMLAERAHAWSVAQERSSSELALDFVSPELVLAARVYGLGAAEAAQAMRLALAGPGQVSAMASAVDRTFVQMMRAESERRRGSVPAGDAAPEAMPAGTAAAAAPAMFGVERRAARGATLWPSATVGALGLHAPVPDGDLQLPLAALELIAAQAVAEQGSMSRELDGSIGQREHSARTAIAATTSEADAIAAAAELVPSARRAKFQALYLALSTSPSSRDAAPAARAARAVALAGRGDDAITARERAAVAWDVLPAIYAGSAPPAMPALAGQRGGDSVVVDGRPGLGTLSARAGEALGSYVTPAAAPTAPVAATSASSSRERSVGAVLRAPTATPELVQTGRSAGRFGGGETEIPAWFEAAAKRMFAEQRAPETFALTELTLVASAPSTQIAASSRAAPSAVPQTPSPGTSASTQAPQQIDIEKTANEVYRQILVLMEATSARNGEPYL
ncbi:MAG TPA: hypothetical protein VMJ10_03635, partial [Kofleriaceae bacterium]|nr:hypothetical protein [Kofleriaceae bacterium]